MSKGKPKGLHVSWMWLVVPAIVAFVAYSNRGSLAGAFRLLGHASLWWLGPAVLAVGGVYLCRASVYGVPLTLFGYGISRSFLWSTAVVATSIHQAIPAAGTTGYAFLTWALHQRGVLVGQASLIALIDTLSNAVAIATLVVASLAYLATAGTLHRQPSILALLLFGALAVAVVAWMYRVQQDRARLTRILLELKDRVASLIGRRWSDAPVRRFLDAYDRGKTAIRERPSVFYRMVGFQFLAVFCDVGALYMVFLAVGVAPPVWVVFMAFVVSTAGLAVISAPGGMGGFEVIMTAFLASVGLDKAQAIAGVILYRLVAFWLPLILSAALLWQFRRRRPGTE